MKSMSSVAALLAAIISPLPALAESLPVLPPVVAAAPVMDPAMPSLQPGNFIWNNELPGTGPLTILVSVPRQLAYVYRNGTLLGLSTVSTGKTGHETPTGLFTILQKKVKHRSNLYDDAPMPFMQRLTWDGVALHAGRVPGHPASHGCIRLPIGFAKKLYGATSLGAAVVVTDAAPYSAEDALSIAAAVMEAGATGAGAALPELASSAL